MTGQQAVRLGLSERCFRVNWNGPEVLDAVATFGGWRGDGSWLRADLVPYRLEMRHQVDEADLYGWEPLVPWIEECLN